MNYTAPHTNEKKLEKLDTTLLLAGSEPNLGKNDVVSTSIQLSKDSEFDSEEEETDDVWE
ncbi:MAG: hypothetical protein ACOYJG_04775 [Prevotella sp.]